MKAQPIEADVMDDKDVARGAEVQDVPQHRKRFLLLFISEKSESPTQRHQLNPPYLRL
jgi:hypothetical protein